MSTNNPRKLTQRQKKQQKQPEQVLPTDKAALNEDFRKKKIRYHKLKRQNKGFWDIFIARNECITAFFFTLKPMRVWNQYNLRIGQVIAAGLAFLMFFSVTSLVAIALALVGMVLDDSYDVILQLCRAINRSAPGLFEVDGHRGLINPQTFLNSRFLVNLGIVAVFILLFSALGWMSATRDGIRSMFELGKKQGNIIMLKLRDLTTLVILGISGITSILLATFATQMFRYTLEQLGVEGDVVKWLLKLGALFLAFMLDFVNAVIIFRVASDVLMPFKSRIQTYLIAALGISILRILGTSVLGAATRNPALAVYAIPLGLLIWFNFMNMIYLISACWGAVSTADEKASTKMKRSA